MANDSKDLVWTKVYVKNGRVFCRFNQHIIWLKGVTREDAQSLLAIERQYIRIHILERNDECWVGQWTGQVASPDEEAFLRREANRRRHAQRKREK